MKKQMGRALGAVMGKKTRPMAPPIGTKPPRAAKPTTPPAMPGVGGGAGGMMGGMMGATMSRKPRGRM